MSQNSSSSSIYWPLFFTFFRIGAFTLGGGYAMLSLVQQAVVDKRKWITEKDFWNMITLVQTLPGVFAVNTALYVGYRIRGFKASFCAMLGAVLPSILIIIVLSVFFSSMWQNPIVNAIFMGIRPCVVALILVPSVKMVKSVGLKWSAVWIPLLAVVSICVFYVSPVYVILFFSIGGLLWGLISASLIKRKENKSC